MANWKFFWQAVEGGAVGVIATGAYNSTPGVLGSTWLGLPLAWIRYAVVLHPVGVIDFFGLAVDLVVWSVVAAIVLFISARLGKRRRAR